jgi:hypothetical protein
MSVCLIIVFMYFIPAQPMIDIDPLYFQNGAFVFPIHFSRINNEKLGHTIYTLFTFCATI